jgi:hypothetical protein
MRPRSFTESFSVIIILSKVRKVTGFFRKKAILAFTLVQFIAAESFFFSFDFPISLSRKFFYIHEDNWLLGF